MWTRDTRDGVEQRARPSLKPRRSPKPLPTQVTSEEAKHRRTTFFYVSFGHCRKDGRIGQRIRNLCAHVSNNGGHEKRANFRRNSTHTCLRKSEVYSNTIGLKTPKTLRKMIHITIYSSFLFLVFFFPNQTDFRSTVSQKTDLQVSAVCIQACLCCW